MLRSSCTTRPLNRVGVPKPRWMRGFRTEDRREHDHRSVDRKAEGTGEGTTSAGRGARDDDRAGGHRAGDVSVEAIPGGEEQPAGTGRHGYGAARQRTR